MDATISLPNKPQALTDELLNAYISKFLQISDFKTIQNGRVLLQLIKNNSDNQKVKSAVRKIVGLFACEIPAARVCSLQFLKEAIETGSFYVVQNIQKSMISQFAEIIDYRSNIVSMQRGTTFFVKDIDKNTDDDQFTNLMKLSSTFFRMVHQCLYVWGAIYFPGSLFDKLRLKIQKKTAFPQFPKDFKFFSETKIANFKTNCQGLIKKMQQRILLNAQTNSLLSKKSKSLTEDKSGLESPRMIKKTKDIKQPAPKIHKDLSLKAIKDKEQKKIIEEQQLQKQILDHPLKSQRTKKHSKKKGKKPQKKEFVENNQQIEPKQLENNSSRLRKKNSFNEIPIGMLHQQQQSYSSQQFKANNNQSRQSSNMIPTSRQGAINKITQKEQSEGGRYSIQESEQISQIQYDYNKKQSLSPSHYSPINRQKKQFKKEISKQLPPNPHKNAQTMQINKKQKERKEPQKQIVQKKLKKNENTSKQVQEITKSQQKNIKLQEKQRNKEKKDSQKKDNQIRKSEQSNRKKFVSSQQQSMRQIKQGSSPKVKNISQSKFQQNKIYQSNQQMKKQPSISKQATASISKQQRPPKPIQNNNLVVDAPVKQPKPIKLKSNTNLKTLFESSQYKMVEINKPKELINKPNIATTTKANKLKLQQRKQNSKPRQQKSIFQIVQVDTIQTINQIPSIPYTNDVQNSAAQKQNQQIQQQSEDLPIISTLQSQSQKQSTVFTKKDVKDYNLKEKEQPLINKIVNQNKQQASQLQIHKQQNVKKPINATKSPQKIQNIKLKPTKQMQLTKTLNVKTSLNINKKIQHINHDQIVRQQQQASKPSRNIGIHSSRFRQFKQVNLFIQPNSPRKSQSISESEKVRSNNQQQLKSILKQQILQEFSKLKSIILEKQQQSLNQTLANVQNQIVKKDSYQVGVECSTQTKIRHKSKTNFERKGKYKKFNDSSSIQNSSDLNLPKLAPNMRDEISKLNTINNLQHTVYMKKVENEKEQLRPNTLLYALYKRKSIKLQ